MTHETEDRGRRPCSVAIVGSKMVFAELRLMHFGEMVDTYYHSVQVVKVGSILSIVEEGGEGGGEGTDAFRIEWASDGEAGGGGRGEGREGGEGGGERRTLRLRNCGGDFVKRTLPVLRCL